MCLVIYVIFPELRLVLIPILSLLALAAIVFVVLLFGQFTGREIRASLRFKCGHLSTQCADYTVVQEAQASQEIL